MSKISKPEQMTSRVQLLVLPSDRAKLEARARKAGMSLSDFLRQALGLDPAPMGRQAHRKPPPSSGGITPARPGRPAPR